MKSNLIYGLLSVMFFFTSCNEEIKKENNRQDKITEDLKPPNKIISLNEAKIVYDNYTKKRADLIEANEPLTLEGKKFIASRYGDYDIETIKNYIAFVEQEANDAGVKIETLRFYFSTYPDSKEFPDHKKVKNPRQNSFFILPTMKVDTTNLGFYIKEEQGKKEALLIRDYPSFLNTKQDTFYKKSIEEQSLIMNEGSMSPPPKNNSDFN